MNSLIISNICLYLYLIIIYYSLIQNDYKIIEELIGEE